jgi:TonB-linked SusC/RagA family outer membrane protein
MKLNLNKISVLLLVLVAQLTFAQERNVSGIVSDNAGIPLPGVSVLLKGSKTGVQTDFDGTYSIKATSSSVLIFSYVGLTTKEVIASSEKLNVKLSSQSTELQSVVVTALGIKREKKSLGYATQQVKGEDLTKVNTGNVANSLSGKVSGVEIRRNGNIGGSTNVVIRGTTSLSGNNQALWVVDGVPMNNDNTNTRDQVRGGSDGGYDYGNAASDINPEDIETINVLKGAAASALYGSRASSGVIIVTTKKGKKSTGLGITINSGVTQGFIDYSTLPKYQKEYGSGYGSFVGTTDLGQGTHPYAATEDASWGPKFDGQLVYNWNSFYPELSTYGKATPWSAVKNDQNSFYKPSITYINSVAIASGNDNGTFRFGYTSYNQDEGILPNSSYKKDNLNFSASYKISPKTTVSASANYMKNRGKGLNETGYGDGGNGLISSFRQWTSTSMDFNDLENAYLESGRNISWNPLDPTSLAPQFHDNPYFQRYENYNTINRDRLLGNFSINTEINNWFGVSGRASIDTYSQLQEERVAVGSKRTSNSLGKYSRYNKTFNEFNLDLMLNFKSKITDKINFTGLIGGNARRTNSNSIFAATNGGLVVPKIYNLRNSIEAISFPEETDENIGTNSVYANVSFNYDETLYLEGTYRIDQSSTLPLAYNTYTYPSITGTYIFSKSINTDWLSFGKLRLNYAETGGDTSFAQTNSTYPKGNNFGGNPIFSTENTRKNSELQSELTKGYEAGIELMFLNKRVGLDVSYYKTNSTNQILTTEVPVGTGYSNAIINAGNIENSGFEVSANIIPVKTKDFSWEARVNWSNNRNKVIDLGAQKTITLGTIQGISVIAEVGQPVGQLVGSGYKMLNGQRVVGTNGRYVKEAGVVIGDINPDWIGGINNILNYKNFSFSFLIDMKKGGDVFSLDQQYGLQTGIYENTVGNNELGNPKRNPVIAGSPLSGGQLLEGVLADGVTPNTKRTSVSYGAGGSFPQEAFIYDASFIKLREVSLSYKLPSSILSKTFMNEMVFTLNGSNLWIIDKNLPYADPEAGLSSGNLQGVQVGAMPTTRDISFNVKVQF